MNEQTAWYLGIRNKTAKQQHWTQTPQYKAKLKKHIESGSVPMASVKARRVGGKVVPIEGTSKKWTARTQ
jgi:hypothetical protein